MHRLKREHLRLLFDRELQAMIFFCQKKIKTKKWKNLAGRLSNLSEYAINSILNEYWTICKLVYHQKSKINYCWGDKYKLEDVLDLF